MVEDAAPQEVGPSDAGSFDFRLRFSGHPLYLPFTNAGSITWCPSTNDCIIALFDIFCCRQRFDGYLYMIH